MKKEDMVHIYNGILLSHKKEQINAFCSNIAEPRDCHAREFSAGSVLGTPQFHYRGHGLNPWSENQDQKLCSAAKTKGREEIIMLSEVSQRETNTI